MNISCAFCRSFCSSLFLHTRVLTSVAVISFAANAGAATLRAGLARVDITPEQPVTLAGYETRKELSTGIHDPLFARAAVFESAGQRLVIFSTDNLGFYSGTVDPIRLAIVDGCGLQPEELFLTAIHTHSAPRLVLDADRGHSNNIAYTIFTHCNGTAGYVPTRSSYAEGGYEVRSSGFAPGAGELLADETVRLLRDLKN